MELTIFLAKLIGACLTLMGIAMLTENSLRNIIKDLLKDKSIVFIYNTLGLIAGLALIISHTVWTPNLSGIITGLGWLILIKHLAILFFKDKALAVGSKFIETNWYETWSIVAVLIGLWLLWNGFNP